MSPARRRHPQVLRGMRRRALRGECFVFDQRVGVDPALQETDAAQCFNCLSPLTAAEQQDARYVPGRSCPWCHRSEAEQAAQSAAAAQPGDPRRDASAAGQRAGGDVPPAARAAGMRRPDACSTRSAGCLGHLPAGYWEEECRAGNLLDSRHQVLAATQIVHAGERLLHRLPQAIEPDVNGDVTVSARGRGADRPEQARAAADACRRPFQPQHTAADAEHRLSAPEAAARASAGCQHHRPRDRQRAAGISPGGCRASLRKGASERPISCACRGIRWPMSFTVMRRSAGRPRIRNARGRRTGRSAATQFTVLRAIAGWHHPARGAAADRPHQPDPPPLRASWVFRWWAMRPMAVRTARRGRPWVWTSHRFACTPGSSSSRIR